MFKQYKDFNIQKPFSSFTNKNFNGVTGIILQSEENYNKVLLKAEENYKNWNSKQKSLEIALSYYKLTKRDFCDSDYTKLILWTQDV